MKTKPTSDKTRKPQVKVRDLQPKKDAKGGRINEGIQANHSETLVCDGAF